MARPQRQAQQAEIIPHTMLDCQAGMTNANVAERKRTARTQGHSNTNLSGHQFGLRAFGAAFI
jgi:hypothetical protein